MATLELTSLRYETPTTVLAVTGRSLAISQWSALPIIQPLRFQLTVTPSSYPSPLDISGNPAELIALQAVLQDYSHGILKHHTHPVTVSGITLQPAGATQHQLILGPLHSVPAITRLTLSDLELADWVDLFDQMEGQVRSLPVPLGKPQQQWRQWRQWSSLAAVFVVAVGTVAVWPYLSQPDRDPSTNRPAPIGDATTEFLEAPEGLEEPSLADSGAEAATGAQPQGQEDAANGSAADPARSQGSPSAQSRPKTATSPAPDPTPPPVAPPTPATTPALEAAPEPERSSSPRAARSPQAERAEADAADAASAAPALGAAVPFADDGLTLPRSWQPPEGFTSVLIYQITLTPEGEITAITPVDDRAAAYQDQTGLPEIGTAIADLSETIWVTFYSDGTVEITTNPESP
ncbi:MAG: DUF4335 domain-containing protein [Leptolyngbya sp. RL_3_1]|nr:DUF4335 domain-containing protein [Leptolyngbya sp. RL_3_1]